MRELGIDPKTGKCFIKIQNSEEFEIRDESIEEFNKLVWVDKDNNYPNEEVSMKYVHNITWAVPKSKVDELEAAKRNDHMLPPPYFTLSNKSWLDYVYLAYKAPLSGGTYVGAGLSYCLGKLSLNMYELFGISKMSPEQRTKAYNDELVRISQYGGNSNINPVLNCHIKFKGTEKELYFCKYIFAAMLVIGVSSFAIGRYATNKATINYPSYHNCDSWAREKLDNLNVKQICDDVKSGFFDYFMSSPSVHLGDGDERVEFAKMCLREPLRVTSKISEVTFGKC